MSNREFEYPTTTTSSEYAELFFSYKEMKEKFQKIENFISMSDALQNQTNQPGTMTGYFNAIKDLKELLK